MANTLTEALARLRRGGYSSSNLGVNQDIKASIQAQRDKRAALAQSSMADFLAQPGMAQEYANVQGEQTPDQQQSEAIGRAAGYANPTINRIGSATPGVPSYATNKLETGNTLADFIRNPALGAVAAPMITEQRKATQAIIKSNLDLQRQTSLEQMKEDFKRRKITDIGQLTPNEISNMVKAVYPLGNVPPNGIQEAFQSIFGQVASDIPLGKQQADLTPGEQELYNKKKGKK